MTVIKCYILEELKPIMVMLLCQILGGTAGIFYKLAMADGMKVEILVLYRLVFATAFITPLAFIFERNKRPKLTWRIVLHGFVCGLLGAALTGNLFGMGLKLTSATYAAAMTNLIPAVTFIMAIIFRLEGLNIRTSAGIAKILGTLMSITGAMVFTFFKGIKITPSSTHIDLLHQRASMAVPKNHFLGSLLALFSCFSYASWLIVQAKVRYPSYSSIAMMSFMGSILSGIYALCIVRADWSSWKLAWNIRLLATAYSGLVSSGIATVITASCAMIKGPLFVSSFIPLGPLCVAIIESLCLGEMLHLGSIIGSVMIVLGLYIVLWGKGKEIKTDDEELLVAAAEGKSSEQFEIDISVGIIQAIGNPKNVQNSDNYR